MRKILTLCVIAGLTLSMKAQIPEDYIARYSFEGSLIDSTAPADAGYEFKTVDGSVKYASGPDEDAGQAVEFDGNYYLSIVDPGVSKFDLTGPVTFSLWIKETQFLAYNNQRNYFIKGDAAYKVSTGWSSNGLSFSYDPAGGDKDINTGGPNPDWINNWIHVAAVYDPANDTSILFVDGVKVVAGKGTHDINLTNSEVSIGGGNGRAKANGLWVDEVKVYNYALTETQVQLLANEFSPLKVTSPPSAIVQDSLTGVYKEPARIGLTWNYHDSIHIGFKVITAVNGDTAEVTDLGFAERELTFGATERNADYSVGIFSYNARGNSDTTWVNVTTGSWENLALFKTASASNAQFGGTPDKAVDNNTNGSFGDGSVIHTEWWGSHGKWWQVDLGKSFDIDTIVVWNRTDFGDENALALQNFYVYVSDTDFDGTDVEVAKAQSNWYQMVHPLPSPYVKIPVHSSGQFIRVQGSNTKALVIAEVQVFEGTAKTVTTPAAPTGLTAEALDTSKVYLEWTDNSDNESEFLIERKFQGEDWDTVYITGAGDMEYLDYVDSANVALTYRVTAVNVAGSASSTEVNVTTLSADPVKTIDDYIGYWGFDRTLVDSSSYGNHAENAGAEDVTFIDGKWGLAADFNGNNALVINEDDIYDFKDEMSISFWAKAADNLAGHDNKNGIITIGRHFEFTKVWSGEGFFMDIYAGNRFDTRNYLSTDDSTYFQFGEWHHYVLTINVNDTAAILYADGDSIDSKPWASFKNILDYPLVIGSYANNYQKSTFIGALDALKIYDFALTHEQVLELKADTFEVSIEQPTNLQASVDYDNAEIVLTWDDNSTNEDGFEIIRNDVKILPYNKIGDVGSDVVTFADSPNVFPNETNAYRYYIRAYNMLAESRTDTIEVFGFVLPAAPDGLTAELDAEEVNTVNLSWNDNAEYDQGYIIWRKDAGDYVAVDTVGLVTAYADASLAYQTTYSYKVVAMNKLGISEESNEVTILTGATGISTHDAMLKIYPNPASNVINIQGVEVNKVLIYSFTGAKLLEVNNMNKEVNLSGLSKGLYILEIETVEGTTYVRKIVKQ